MKTKVVAIVQARMGSTRFPGKVMLPICGTPMIGLLLKRLSKSKYVDQIILATSENKKNNQLADYVSGEGFEVYRGSEDDVLDRYYKTAEKYSADIVVRITGDCPLIDPDIVDEVIKTLISENLEYSSNIMPPTYPDGLDAEAFTFGALENAWLHAKEKNQREHVTPYIQELSKHNSKNIANLVDYSSERWTVDEPEDFEVIKRVFEHFSSSFHFSWIEVLKIRDENQEWFELNRKYKRNGGINMGTGQKLWNRAKRVIPGGNMLLSKRAEMFLPDKWPAYYSRAKGCRVWDLDDNEYIDTSIMGIGTNILGYGHPEVDEAVHNVIKSGNMSTFNCPEEVYLAERLTEIHPWADMARFARTGGEANSIAIRITRAASGKDKVAICGYHGWHDWYLAANLNDDKSLDGHLLPGLEPKGVPRELKGSVLPFNYNNFSELEELVEKHDIGTIKMEVSRNKGPENNFLKKVRELATDNNIILIFDECTSGFRQTFGGLHKYYGVEPDMAIFGKALGNGYAISAVIGRREIMQAAQSTFISSTFWTERIGPAAALKTLEVMEREKSWEQITNTGKEIGTHWQELAQKYELPIQIYGLPALISFMLPLPDMLKYKTFITQEMLKKGYLAENSIYVCTKHSSEVIEGYFKELEPIFGLIKECETGRSIDELLEGPVCHSGFKRLN